MRFSILALLIGLGLAGCGGGESAASSTPPAAPAAPAANNAVPEQSNVQATQPAAAPAPAHYYAMEEDGEYGYESGISENEKKAGQVAAEITMVRYRGIIKGYYILTSTKNGVTTTLSCKDQCEFAKLSNSAGGVTSDPETIRLAVGSLGWAMAQDAIHGQLMVYHKL